MIRRYFIADLHLNQNNRLILNAFFKFLEQLPAPSELYILGDFFDYWVGDDVMDAMQEKVIQQLAKLPDRGINVFFMSGNRDFLIGEKTARKSQFTLLGDFHFISETQSLLLHGDLLCTQDAQYQSFRKKVRSQIRQAFFLRLPRWIRLWIARQIRRKSTKANQIKSEQLMDVDAQTVADLLMQHQARTMIHGHTHKPSREETEFGTRFVLGAWHDAFNYLYQDENGHYHYVEFDH